MPEEKAAHWPSARSFLRQHYLDQVHGSSAFRAKLSALRRYSTPVGSPNSFKPKAICSGRQLAKFIFKKSSEPKLAIKFRL
jgi:hypothetical protein